jgi:hypothetical protein
MRVVFAFHLPLKQLFSSSALQTAAIRWAAVSLCRSNVLNPPIARCLHVQKSRKVVFHPIETAPTPILALKTLARKALVALTLLLPVQARQRLFFTFCFLVVSFASFNVFCCHLVGVFLVHCYFFLVVRDLGMCCCWQRGLLWSCFKRDLHRQL